MERSLKLGLRALNDIYIVLEDPIEVIAESDSGLTPDVVDALKSKLLIIPDTFASFAEKFPCTGLVVSSGAMTKLKVPVGRRIGYSRLGVQRYKLNGLTFCDIRERDIHYEILY